MHVLRVQLHESGICLHSCVYTRARTPKNAQRHRNDIETVNRRDEEWMWGNLQCGAIARIAHKMTFSKSALIIRALLILYRKLVSNISHAVLYNSLNNTWHGLSETVCLRCTLYPKIQIMPLLRSQKERSSGSDLCEGVDKCFFCCCA